MIGSPEVVIYLADPTIIALVAMTAMQVATAATAKGPPKLPTPEPPAQLGDEGRTAAAKMAEARRRQAQQGGRASTIMTSPLGVTGSPAMGKKLLTGV